MRTNSANPLSKIHAVSSTGISSATFFPMFDFLVSRVVIDRMDDFNLALSAVSKRSGNRKQEKVDLRKKMTMTCVFLRTKTEFRSRN